MRVSINHKLVSGLSLKDIEKIQIQAKKTWFEKQEIRFLYLLNQTKDLIHYRYYNIRRNKDCLIVYYIYFLILPS